MAIGYSGFALAAGDPLVIGDGICSRTQQVQDGILAKLNGVDPAPDPAVTCEMVTNALLATITGTLSFLGSSVGSLQAGDFAGLSEVTELDLLSNNLMSLPSGVFSGLTKLTTLTLSLNNLTESTTASDVFSGLTSLTTLNLDSNAFTELPAGLFSGLTNLTTLNLASNSLTELPADIFNPLTSLITLRLNNNNLTALPPGIFSGLINLITIDLSNNPSADPALFTLTVTLVSTMESSGGNPGMAVIEIVEGVPFDFAATVSISGGTLAGGMTTMENVMIPKGSIRSDPFPFTADPNDISTLLTVTPTSPLNSNIDNNYAGVGVTGYSGFELAAGEPLIIGDGICSRTPQVRDGILEEINDATPPPDTEVTCLTVTNALLATISGTLSLRDPTINDGPGDVKPRTILPHCKQVTSPALAE